MSIISEIFYFSLVFVYYLFFINSIYIIKDALFNNDDNNKYVLSWFDFLYFFYTLFNLVVLISPILSSLF